VKDKRCPNCGHALPLETGMGHDSPPSPGDFTVCLYCCQVNQFTADLTLERCHEVPDSVKELVERTQSMIRESRGFSS
jgi:hypothetical protein